VTSIESLLMRGYDTEVLVMMEGGLGNAGAIRKAVGDLPHKRLAVVTLPAAPSPDEVRFLPFSDCNQREHGVPGVRIRHTYWRLFRWSV